MRAGRTVQTMYGLTLDASQIDGVIESTDNTVAAALEQIKSVVKFGSNQHTPGKDNIS